MLQRTLPQTYGTNPHDVAASQNQLADTPTKINALCVPYGIA
jgi:hypothetical protein